MHKKPVYHPKTLFNSLSSCWNNFMVLNCRFSTDGNEIYVWILKSCRYLSLCISPLKNSTLCSCETEKKRLIGSLVFMIHIHTHIICLFLFFCPLSFLLPLMSTPLTRYTSSLKRSVFCHSLSTSHPLFTPSMLSLFFCMFSLLWFPSEAIMKVARWWCCMQAGNENRGGSQTRESSCDHRLIQCISAFSIFTPACFLFLFSVFYFEFPSSPPCQSPPYFQLFICLCLSICHVPLLLSVSWWEDLGGLSFPTKEEMPVWSPSKWDMS